jgi:hypothetical protein
MARKQRQGKCTYCGSETFVTKDHVPPKCLFPPNTRINLITVKACTECHDTFKLDDEYFRVMLSLRQDLQEGEDAIFLREQTKRTLKNPSATNFRASIIKNIVPISAHTYGIKIDSNRIKNTSRRIIHGLYGNYFKKPLPPTHEVSATVLDFQKDVSALERPEVQEILTMLEQHGTHRSFGKTFSLSYLSTDDDMDSTFWFIKMHNVFCAIGFTNPRDV